MTQSAYKAAPITEAVLEIRFSEAISTEAIEKASGKFAETYPGDQNLENVTFNIQVSKDKPEASSAALNRHHFGHRRSSSDMTELLVITETAFVESQLAPYPGWDAFHGRFARDWRIWKRLVGYRQISRIGVRFINRIDIPVSGPIVEFEDYLNLYAKVPDAIGHVNGYAVQSVSQLIDIGCQLKLNSGVVPSPILDHASFLLDQDISTEANPPQRDEEIDELLFRIRDKKNEVFEACITNLARELFQ